MFEIDVDGFRRIFARHGDKMYERAAAEIIGNAWDSGATEVEIALTDADDGTTVLTVLDNGTGFSDITQAYTLFGRSTSAANPEKRGRFCLGDKIAAVAFTNMHIKSGDKWVEFSDGKRTGGEHYPPFIGTCVEATMPTGLASEAVKRVIAMLIPPPGIRTFVGADVIEPPTKIGRQKAFLETVMMSDNGILKTDWRTTEVVIYRPKPGERACIYEMGIPVLATDDTFSVDVQQKIPMNAERDNVDFYFRMSIRAVALNCGWASMTPEEACEGWVNDALASNIVSKDAVNGVLTLRFGALRVREDATDPEATKKAMSMGYTVVPNSTFSTNAWSQIIQHDGLRRAGEVMPTLRSFGAGGTPIIVLPDSEWTDGMRQFASIARTVAEVIIGVPNLKVVMTNDPAWTRGLLAYGKGEALHVNALKLGEEWFAHGFTRDQRVALIHELAHEAAADHLSAAFHHELCRIGAELSIMAEQGEFS